MNHLTASFANSLIDTCQGNIVDSERSWHRAWCEVDRFLRDGDWLDTYSNSEARDYGYLHGFLRRYNDFASQLFGGYSQQRPGDYVPFQLIEKEKQKKAHPIAFFIAARAPLDVIEEVYNMYPSARLQRQGEDQGFLLHIACRHGVSLDVLAFLIEKHKQALLEFDFKGNLPLHCATKCRQWNTQPHSTLEIFQLLVENAPKTAILQDNLLAISPLMYCLKNKTLSTPVIQYLVQELRPTNFDGAIQFCASVINDSCARNLAFLMPKLRYNHDSMLSHSLIMKSCNIDKGALRTVFAGATAPISLLLANCKILDHHDSGSGPNTTENYRLSSRIEQLCIDDCSMKGECFLWLLNQILYNMPNLKHLTLTKPSRLLREVNITDFVTTILRMPAASLSYLSIDGFAIDLKALIFTLARENNTTYVSYKNNVHDPRVQYYSTLNQYGRAVAQNPRSTCHDMVQHLHSLNKDDSLDENFKVVTAYGLLRECPIIWSAAGEHH